MPPEEQLSLEEVERNARRTNAARRKAGREEKESTEAQDQPDSEPAAQDAHHVSLGAATPDDEEKVPPSGSEVNSTPDSEVEVVGVSIPDVPAQASVGGTVKVESSAVDKPSGTSRPAQDVIVPDDDSDESLTQARMIKEESPLLAVQEGPVPSLLNATSRLRSSVSIVPPEGLPRVALTSGSRMVFDFTDPGDESRIPMTAQADASRIPEVRSVPAVDTLFPASPVPVAPDDVVMSESGRTGAQVEDVPEASPLQKVKPKQLL
ncbi:hypothetical protein PHYSODRAFT_253977 [Phytophthora sojae]|uniref:Uncharacterized protein n=1 Tax=Phytophthora sojae (strain P6497) TaxID=1094619 RepID=G4ZJJ3_PHYSP|nr:hypothetical protein PHYSODRAFT_253977 [Phytophthora sojae]EGZ18858.1 hypothetical protein PHYSODRAFT_253977 [Phytophthora sojae]|eukprot:XP_009527916.1 hypothetical protein PHYSODRAFT_253977 [Phytophthora sojae]